MTTTVIAAAVCVTRVRLNNRNMNLDESFAHALARNRGAQQNGTKEKKEFTTKGARRRENKTKHESDTLQTTHKIHGFELRRRRRGR